MLCNLTHTVLSNKIKEIFNFFLLILKEDSLHDNNKTKIILKTKDLNSSLNKHTRSSYSLTNVLRQNTSASSSINVHK